jgi:uncharacterized protein (DUF983 family)
MDDHYVTPTKKSSNSTVQKVAGRTCPHCGSDNLFTQQRGQHVGLYCAPCGRWLPQGRPIEIMPFGPT